MSVARGYAMYERTGSEYYKPREPKPTLTASQQALIDEFARREMREMEQRSTIWDSGYNAAEADQLESSCPYMDEYSRESVSWHGGFEKGQAEKVRREGFTFRINGDGY